MNDSPAPGYGARPPRHQRARAVAGVITVSAAALLATACGGSSSPSATGQAGAANQGGSANSQSAVAYADCVRAHGIPDFPGPDSTGQIPKEAIVQLRVSGSVLAAATGACAKLNPAGQAPVTITAQDQRDYLKAAACMRAHGFAGFPDPVFSGGTVDFPIPSSIDTTSKQFTDARQTCAKLIPAGLPESGSDG